ncbi:MAG: hypothetical protein PHW46_04170, partial [Candidatus Omnitrophica bacterium]|nr:hypothetical protein [Candidatus Omnitrophota bacterium]
WDMQPECLRSGNWLTGDVFEGQEKRSWIERITLKRRTPHTDLNGFRHKKDIDASVTHNKISFEDIYDILYFSVGIPLSYEQIMKLCFVGVSCPEEEEKLLRLLYFLEQGASNKSAAGEIRKVIEAISSVSQEERRYTKEKQKPFVSEEIQSLIKEASGLLTQRTDMNRMVLINSPQVGEVLLQNIKKELESGKGSKTDIEELIRESLNPIAFTNKMMEYLEHNPPESSMYEPILFNMISKYSEETQKDFLKIVIIYLKNEIPDVSLFTHVHKDAELVRDIHILTLRWHLWNTQSMQEIANHMKHRIGDIRARKGQSAKVVLVTLADGYGDLGSGLQGELSNVPNCRVVITDGYKYDISKDRGGMVSGFDKEMMQKRGVKKFLIEDIGKEDLRQKLGIGEDEEVIVVGSQFFADTGAEKALLEQTNVDEMVIINSRNNRTNRKIQGDNDIVPNAWVWDHALIYPDPAVWCVTAKTENEDDTYQVEINLLTRRAPESVPSGCKGALNSKDFRLTQNEDGEISGPDIFNFLTTMLTGKTSFEMLKNLYDETDLKPEEKQKFLDLLYKLEQRTVYDDFRKELQRAIKYVEASLSEDQGLSQKKEQPDLTDQDNEISALAREAASMLLKRQDMSWFMFACNPLLLEKCYREGKGDILDNIAHQAFDGKNQQDERARNEYAKLLLKFYQENPPTPDDYALILLNEIQEFDKKAQIAALKIFVTYLKNEIPDVGLFKEMGYSCNLFDRLQCFTVRWHFWNNESMREFGEDVKGTIKCLRDSETSGEEIVIVTVADGYGDTAHGLKQELSGVTNIRVIATDGLEQRPTNFPGSGTGDYDPKILEQRGVKRLLIEDIANGTFRDKLGIGKDPKVIVVASHLRGESNLEKMLLEQANADEVIIINTRDSGTNRKVNGDKNIIPDANVWNTRVKYPDPNVWVSGTQAVDEEKAKSVGSIDELAKLEDIFRPCYMEVLLLSRRISGKNGGYYGGALGAVDNLKPGADGFYKAPDVLNYLFSSLGKGIPFRKLAVIFSRTFFMSEEADQVVQVLDTLIQKAPDEKTRKDFENAKGYFLANRQEQSAGLADHKDQGDPDKSQTMSPSYIEETSRQLTNVVDEASVMNAPCTIGIVIKREPGKNIDEILQQQLVNELGIMARKITKKMNKDRGIVEGELDNNIKYVILLDDGTDESLKEYKALLEAQGNPKERTFAWVMMTDARQKTNDRMKELNGVANLVGLKGDYLPVSWQMLAGSLFANLIDSKKVNEQGRIDAIVDLIIRSISVMTKENYDDLNKILGEKLKSANLKDLQELFNGTSLVLSLPKMIPVIYTISEYRKADKSVQSSL